MTDSGMRSWQSKRQPKKKKKKSVDQEGTERNGPVDASFMVEIQLDRDGLWLIRSKDYFFWLEDRKVLDRVDEQTSDNVEDYGTTAWIQKISIR